MFYTSRPPDPVAVAASADLVERDDCREDRSEDDRYNQQQQPLEHEHQHQHNNPAEYRQGGHDGGYEEVAEAESGGSSTHLEAATAEYAHAQRMETEEAITQEGCVHVCV